MAPKQWPRRRPPWWPEEQPWPPAGSPGVETWRRMRGRLFWRIGGLLILLFISTVGGCTVVFWVTAHLLGLIDLPYTTATLARAAALVALLMGSTGLIFAVRALRQTAAPVDAVMAGVSRVSAGDYDVRVPERGPRELRALARAFNGMVARLQASEAQRRKLLADVTHELRTPLTVMQGNLEGVLDGVYPPDAEHLRPILDETRVLARLIDDLRTIALTESGALTLYREPVDLGQLAGEVLSAFRPQAQGAGVTLTLDAADDVATLNLDPVRMREVLANLITNALRYTPAGGAVRVSVSASHGGVVVNVADTGEGIAPEALPHIFDRFYKAPESRGSGLGLAIAKGLVNAHGGDISAKSRPGEGTTMTVVMPAET